jgi:hypothetical protein
VEGAGDKGMEEEGRFFIGLLIHGRILEKTPG